MESNQTPSQSSQNPQPSQPLYGQQPGYLLPQQFYGQQPGYPPFQPYGQYPQGIPSVPADPTMTNLVIALGGLLGFVAMFVPWIAVTVTDTQNSNSTPEIRSIFLNGWGFWPGIIAGVAFIFALFVAMLRLFRATLNFRPDLERMVQLLFGCLGLIFSGLFYLLHNSANYYTDQTSAYSITGDYWSSVCTGTCSLNFSPNVGLLMALVAAIIVLIGALRIPQR